MVNFLTTTDDKAAVYDPIRDDPFTNFGIGPRRDILLSGVNSDYTADAAAEDEEEEWRRFFEEINNSHRYDSYNFTTIDGVRVSRNDYIRGIDKALETADKEIRAAQQRGDHALAAELTQDANILHDARVRLHNGNASVSEINEILVQQGGGGGTGGRLLDLARGAATEFARGNNFTTFAPLSGTTASPVVNGGDAGSPFVNNYMQHWRNTRTGARGTIETIDRAAQDANRWWNSDPVVRTRADAAQLVSTVSSSCLATLDEWGVFKTRRPQGYGNLRVPEVACETSTEIERERLLLRQASAENDFLGNGVRDGTRYLGQRFGEAADIAGRHVAQATDYALSDASDAQVAAALQATEAGIKTVEQVSGEVFRAARGGAEQTGKAVSRTFQRVAEAEERGELPEPAAVIVRATRDTVEEVGRAANAVGSLVRSLFS